MPPLIIIFAPSSGVMSKILISSRFEKSRKPEVGLGVVGTKTQTYPGPSVRSGAPCKSVVMKPIAHIPAFGRMIASGRFNDVPLMASLIIGVPVIAVGLGWLTRSAVAARLILLLLWYAHVSSAGLPAF